MSTCYEQEGSSVLRTARPVLHCTAGVTAQPSPEIMATSSASPTKDHGPLRWGLPDNLCVSSEKEDTSRPNSAASTVTSSSSDAGYDHLSAKRSEVKCGYDKIDMSFILGDDDDEESEMAESAESEASRLRYRRQFRRQFGMTQAGSSRSMDQYPEGHKDQESSSDDDEGEVEVLYKADVTVKPNDMDIDENVDDCDDENDGCNDEDEEIEEMIVKDTSNNEADEGGWITEEEEPEKPPKRIKTSKSASDSDSESGSESDKKESDSSDDEKKNDSDGSGVDMSAFLDSNDPVYSYPSGPIKLSVEEVADYKQEECGSGRYYNFGSEEMGFDEYFESLAKRDESESEDEDYFCMTCFSMSAGLSYAFPRVTPRRIEQLVKFWEKDFQVGNYVYPNMGSWESKGIEPNRQVHPASDCRKYAAFKTLYSKWQECNKSREQWYGKYRSHSLVDIANGRTESYVQKQKTDSTFRSLCPVDIAAQCRSQSQHSRRRQRSNPHRRPHMGGLSSAMVY